MQAVKFLVILCVLFGVGCSSNSGPTTSPTTTAVMKMKVNGVQWNSTNTLSVFVKAASNGGIDGLTLSGEIANEKMLLLFYVPTMGTYTITGGGGSGSNQNPNQATYTKSANGATQLYTASALSSNAKSRMTINWNKRGIALPSTVIAAEGIEADFSGVLYRTASDSIVITEGTVRYQ